MQLHSNGQLQRSAAQWSEIIARYRQSGLGSRQFCEAEGVTLRTFEKWYRRIRRIEDLVTSREYDWDRRFNQ